MDANAVAAYLHEHIPITKEMGIVVTACSDDAVTLTAALQPNLNHRCTAFGGSIATLGILAGWSMLYLRLQNNDPFPRIVIQHSETDFISAIESDFSARCCSPPAGDWLRFKKTLQRKHRARIKLVSEIIAAGKPAARHAGDFVAIGVAGHFL
jgi:thioesterase domain-containing protein